MKIPKGWVKLKRGTTLFKSDHCLYDELNGKHCPTDYAGLRVGENSNTDCTYIRRIKRKKPDTVTDSIPR